MWAKVQMKAIVIVNAQRPKETSSRIGIIGATEKEIKTRNI